MKNRSRGTAFTSTKHTLISLFLSQEAQEPCLSIESPAKTVRRLIHVFTGYTGKCRKSCALALYAGLDPEGLFTGGALQAKDLNRAAQAVSGGRV